MTEYEAIREKAATQKRDIEKALTKFLAKTSETHSLFDTEDNMFPCKQYHMEWPPTSINTSSLSSNSLQAGISSLLGRFKSY